MKTKKKGKGKNSGVYSPGSSTKAQDLGFGTCTRGFHMPSKACACKKKGDDAFVSRICTRSVVLIRGSCVPCVVLNTVLGK